MREVGMFNNDEEREIKSRIKEPGLLSDIIYCKPQTGVDGVLKDCYNVASTGHSGVEEDVEYLLTTIKKNKKRPNEETWKNVIQPEMDFVLRRVKSIKSATNVAYKMSDSRYVYINGMTVRPVDVIIASQKSLESIRSEISGLLNGCDAMGKTMFYERIHKLLIDIYSAQDAVAAMLNEKTENTVQK